MSANSTSSSGTNSNSLLSSDENSLKKAITYDNVYHLNSNWQIQSSAIATQEGETLSTDSYNTDGWFNTTVPNTVMGALIEAGDIEDPYIHDRIAFTDESRFEVPWWYRTEFILPASETGKEILVNFQGIGYKADIWVNGNKIADKKDIVGSFRTYELNITDYVVADGATKNTIAVEVTKSDFGKDFSVYWVDWVPRPTDNNMGLWRDVFITTSGAVTTRNPFVTSKVDKDLSKASLNAYVDVTNIQMIKCLGQSKRRLKILLVPCLASISQPVSLEAGEKEQEVAFTVRLI